MLKEIFPAKGYDTRNKHRFTQRNEEFWNGKYAVKYKSHFSNFLIILQDNCLKQK